ncbi:hypothetical protein LSTR_LSTR013672 [Laodelphax striatellus]|uniref:Cadherin domain-containing protein n=1 Tax=Laodelphax striatellus TaxID=195883 RepID=A0A482XDU6_LAOST|nr:hypothetical protein LSTR_LSTR013672 [Laodelphax striatellus]
MTTKLQRRHFAEPRHQPDIAPGFNGTAVVVRTTQNPYPLPNNLPSPLNLKIHHHAITPTSILPEVRKAVKFSHMGTTGHTDNQRVIIHVKDVNDEPPYFINRPLPMQAVVQLNAPPNTPVFTLQARAPDTDHNIHYFIVRDRTGGRFEVDERSGVVRTRGTDPFQLDMEYVLYVKAEDQNGRVDERRYQSTPEERLSIVGGKRAPQFYMPTYEAEIPENQKKDSDIISVKAKSFADREIRYTLKAQGQGAGTFNIGPTSGIVKLAKELDFEDLRQPHVYSLIVTATEDSG